MIDSQTTIGEVHLTIPDLDRSVRFYQSHLGLHLHARDDRTVRLGARDRDLLALTASATAPRVRGTTGLYHFAILVPSRTDLARALRRLIETNTVMQGAADHGVSEALYLADPDGNGIEIYRDRPREHWPMRNGRLQMATDPLDLDSLLAEPSSGEDAGMPAGTVMGHVHLHVASLDAAQRFYVDVLGLELMQRYGPSAMFVSAGGYHHHIGLNTWAGVGAPPPPPGAIGLKYFVVKLPNAAARADVEARLREASIPIERIDGALLVRDPSNNALCLRS